MKDGSPGPGSGAAAARFSVIVPAFNEARFLPHLLDSIDAARGTHSVEVIVADNASTDSTPQIARDRGCKVTRVEKRMIAAVRNGGAAVAKGDIVAFIDADSRIHPETFDVIEEILSSGRYVGGATGLVPERWSLGILATWMILSPTAWFLGLDAGVVFCRRADFEAVGGYPEDRLFAEDVAFLLRLRDLGRSRSQRLARNTRAKATMSARKFDEQGDWHYFRIMVRAGPLVFRPGTTPGQDIVRYWYDPRR